MPRGARPRFDGGSRRRAGEIGLEEAVCRLETGRRAKWRATIAVVHALGLRVLVKAYRRRAEGERAVPVHEEAFASEPDGRLEQSRPRQLAESAMRELVCGDGAGD